MSHFVSIETQIKDLEALDEACIELGIRLMHQASCRGYGGIERKAQHTIELNGPYDIAVDSNEIGFFVLTTDWWGGHVEKEVGSGFGRLLQSYAVHKTVKEARQRGFRTSQQVQEDGSVFLTLEGGHL